MPEAKVFVTSGEPWHKVRGWRRCNRVGARRQMIYNDDVLFIHVPKTAGMSLTAYLAENLKGEVFNVTPHAPKDGPATKMNHVPGPRHANLPVAEEFFRKLARSIQDFKILLSVVRCPYDLEVSRFHYLRLNYAWDVGLDKDIALRGDFKEFCRDAPFLNVNPACIERFYTLGGQLPPNSRIVRFESLNPGLEFALKGHVSDATALPRINATRRHPHQDYRAYYDGESEEAVYRKYRWLFDAGYYAREKF